MVKLMDLDPFVCKLQVKVDIVADAKAQDGGDSGEVINQDITAVVLATDPNLGLAWHAVRPEPVQSVS